MNATLYTTHNASLMGLKVLVVIYQVIQYKFQALN